MKHRLLSFALIAVLGLVLGAGGAAGQGSGENQGGVILATDVNSRISYQGVLKEGGALVTGVRDMTVRLFGDAACTTLFETIVKNGVPVSEGLFSMALDVHPAYFSGQAMWLQVEVGGTVIGCQEILPVPYALGLRPGASIDGTLAFPFEMFSVENRGDGVALSVRGNGEGVLAMTSSSSEYHRAVSGYNYGSGDGVYGASVSQRGVLGRSDGTSSDAVGVYGLAFGSSGVTRGVYGETDSSTDDAAGVQGLAQSNSGTTYGVFGKSNSAAGYGVFGESVGGIAICGVSTDRTGVWGQSTNGTGVWGLTNSDAEGATGTVGLAQAATGKTYGVYGRTDSSTDSAAGLYGLALADSGATYGVYGKSNSADGYGVFGESTNGDAVRGATTSSDSLNSAVAGINSGAGDGVYGYSANSHGVLGRADSTTPGTAGVYGFSNASTGATYGVYGRTDSSGANAAGVYAFAMNGAGHTYGLYAMSNSDSGVGVYGYGKGGTGGKFVSYSGSLIEGWEEQIEGDGPSELRFKVKWNGDVYADGTYQSPAADFAEMLPSVPGLAAHDVLVIGKDGKLTRSTQAYATNVVGVFSSNPAFLGGASEGGDQEGKAPLAVVGVVTVRVTSENGPIQPGDLLVTSSTPGHAMKAGLSPQIGTVLGKALGALESGEGLITILVMLQ